MSDTSRMGDLASPDNGVDWSHYNQPFGELTDPNPVAYKTPYGDIRQGDVNQAIALGTGFAGGGLTTKPMGSVLGAPIRAFHSSPYDFERFSLSHIGRGEGAQIYGHGLYFAENPAVSGQGGEYWNSFLRHGSISPDEEAAASLLKQHGFNRDQAIAHSQQNIGNLQDAIDAIQSGRWQGASQDDLDHYQWLLAQRQRQHEMLTSGAPVGPRTYEVNINADPSQMLNWDRPLGEQPAVMSAIRTMVPQQGRVSALWDDLTTGGMQGVRINKVRGDNPFGDAPFAPPLGSEVYSALGNLLGGKPRASAALSEAGVPGIQYLDAGSRAAGTGSSNYVVFDPSIIDIMKRYGVVGAPAGALGMGSLAAQDEYQQPNGD